MVCGLSLDYVSVPFATVKMWVKWVQCETMVVSSIRDMRSGETRVQDEHDLYSHCTSSWLFIRIFSLLEPWCSSRSPVTGPLK